MNKKSLNYSLLILLLLSFSCQDNELPEPESSGVALEDIDNEISAVPTYPLEWENRDYMPTPPGVSRIWVPWASNASREFSFETANDYRKANGWELVYNTFNEEEVPDKYYFILYNKYSGILRMYLYIPSTSFIPSANLIHTLELEGPYKNNSPILNFSDQIVVDPNTRSRFASSVEKAQVAPGTWYAMEHELAYDENMANQSSSTAFFRWPVRSAQITEVRLNGKIDGSLEGNITIPGVNFALSSSINTTNNVAKNGIVKLTGDGDANSLSKLGQAFFSGAKKALEKAGVGVVENILGGIFGKNSSSNTDNVNLRLDASINLKGTLQQTFLIDSRTFAIPGVDNSNLIGASPAYDKPLGVFYISGRPKIHRKTTNVRQYDNMGQEQYPKKRYTYTVESNSYNLKFNPEVLAVADIRNIRPEVVLRDISYAMISGKLENIGGKFYRTGQVILIPDYAASVIGTRISFDVVPKDGSPKVTVSKTFKSNMSYSTVWTAPRPPGSGPGGGGIPFDLF
ncbi:MAG: hypothetical protein AAFQ94_01965 [Bacteroidota bacterium]